MRTKLKLLAGMIAVMLLTSCQSYYPQSPVAQNALLGGALGGIAGAAIGHQSGETEAGAAIGALGGGLLGGLVGHEQEYRQQRNAGYYQAPPPQYGYQQQPNYQQPPPSYQPGYQQNTTWQGQGGTWQQWQGTPPQ